MAYVKVAGKWVPRSSVSTDMDASGTPATSQASATAISAERDRAAGSSLLAVVTADVASTTEAESLRSYDAMKGAQWIIDDFMCVGNFASAGVTGTTRAREEKRLDLLKHGITHIVNCTREFECPFRNDFEYLQLPATDDTHQNMIAFWPASCDFIEEARALGGRVLVHCAGGHSRSGSTAVAYLMKRNDMRMENALAEAKARRQSIMPNPGFREQLQLFRRLGYVAPAKGELSAPDNSRRFHRSTDSSQLGIASESMSRAREESQQDIRSTPIPNCTAKDGEAGLAHLDPDANEAGKTASTD